MGYYTYYSLEVLDGDDHITDYKSEISDYADYSSCFSDHIKWYDWESDMREYSKHRKNVLFKLTGEGEEAGDLWHAYFKNGKSQICKARITYDSYSESLLK